ncbi:UDP-3-O-(3-hydroxymyristoyl)glucosamine N-acyltransferase [Paeniroseomonas aquatica]|uniref:UDP-3-O-acylglucosamine N-acyltransferase n=1 Tax=Paeniroseomonas aquatica TaxID=373043 RepID=A0ABT8ABB8_9PROT|nr:UDP-3-O-(3-hydroxymyristoyl)glucosamine N-acyltransferase [Paeniroseomonas aquatica]MDN3566624.1 UDP-3-O-(3-hydroxymyristoyl)glucosamine N-acyltransferase [Paeniroseomonas aquatica]
MATDPRFFASAGPQRLADLAAAAGGQAAGDPERRFTGVAPLQAAGPDDVSFLDNRKYLPALKATRAGAVVLAPAMAAQVPPGTIAIVAPAPYLGFARVATLFHPAPRPVPGRHPTAVVADDAVLGEGCEIGPYAVVGAGARLGRGCILHPHAVVGPGVELGEDCRLHAHSSISHAVAGRGVVLHPGARIGQEGFGFAPTADGRFETMPQLGRVLLGDNVEVGANACVDRGSQGDTVIGPGSRLDNLVQIGHNVTTGRGCIIVALAGISGSTTLGDYVQLAAQAGIAGHLEIGSGARIGGQAGVMENVPAKTDVIGSPAWPVREFWRAIARLRKLGAPPGKPAGGPDGKDEGKAG